MTSKSIAGDTGPQSAWARFKQERESSIRDLKLSWYLFRKSPTSMLGAVIVGVFLLMVLIGPSIHAGS